MMMSASNRRSLSNADVRPPMIGGSPDKKANNITSLPPSITLATPVLDDVIGDPGRCFVFARWLDNSDKGDKAGAIHARCAGLCHQYRHQHEGSQAALTTATNIVNRYLSSSCTHPLRLATVTADIILPIEAKVNGGIDSINNTLFEGLHKLLLVSLNVSFGRFLGQTAVLANFDIESVLCHPTRGPAFCAFSKNQYAEEWYLFYNDVEIFKQELTEILNSPPGSDKAARRALFTGMSEQMQGLYDKYLRPRAEYRLAIPDPHCTKVLREIGDALRSGTIVIGMFDECINRAIDRIRTDLFRSFLVHEREEIEATHKFQRAMIEIKSAGSNGRTAVSLLKPVTLRPIIGASSRTTTTSSGIALSLNSPSRRVITSSSSASSASSASSGSLGSLRVGSTTSNGASSSPVLSPLATSIDSPIQSPYLNGQAAGSLPSPLGSPRAILRIRNSSKRWGTWKRKRETPGSPSPRIGSMSPTPHMSMSPLFAPIRISNNGVSTSSSSSSSMGVSSPIRSSSSSNSNITNSSMITTMSRRHSVTLADMSRIADMRRLRRDARIASRLSSSASAAMAVAAAAAAAALSSSSSGGVTGVSVVSSPSKEQKESLRASHPSKPSSSNNNSNGSSSHSSSLIAAKRSRFTNLKDIEGNKYYKGKSLEVSGPELEDLLTMRRQLELEEELEERDEDAKASKSNAANGSNGQHISGSGNSNNNNNGINGHNHDRYGSDEKLPPRLRIESGDIADDALAPQTPMNNPRRTLAQEQAEEDQAEEEEFDEMIYALLSNPLQIGALIKRTAVVPVRAIDDQGLFDDKRTRRRQSTWAYVWNQMGIKLGDHISSGGHTSTNGWGTWSRDISNDGMAPSTPISPVRGLPPPAFPDSDGKVEASTAAATATSSSSSTTILSSMSSLPSSNNGVSTTTSISSSSSLSSSSSSSSTSSSSGAHLHSILGRRTTGRRTVRFDFNYIPPPVSAMSASYIASLPTSSPLLAQVTPLSPVTGSSNGNTSSTSIGNTPSSTVTSVTPLVSLTSTGPGFRQRARSIIKTGRTTRVFETADEAATRVANERDHEREIRLKALADGSLLTKINSMGKAHDRWFQIQEEDLCWGKATSKGTKKAAGLFNRIKRRVLADVIRVRYGTRWSRRFFRYNEKGLPPWLGFSIIFMDRTLDIVCRNDAEVESWFLGLQSLTPLSGAYLTKGAFLWSRIRMKLRYKAREGGLTDRDFLIKILTAAKENHRAAVLQESKTNPAVRSSILLQKNQVLQKVERAERKAASSSSSSSSNGASSPRGSITPSSPMTPRGLPQQARSAALSVSATSAASLVKPAATPSPASPAVAAATPSSLAVTVPSSPTPPTPPAVVATTTANDSSSSSTSTVSSASSCAPPTSDTSVAKKG